MATRNVVSTETQLFGIRDELIEGLRQADSGDLTDGSGAEAVRRTFARARTTS